jgi:hypothetical protein
MGTELYLGEGACYDTGSNISICCGECSVFEFNESCMEHIDQEILDSLDNITAMIDTKLNETLTESIHTRERCGLIDVDLNETLNGTGMAITTCIQDLVDCKLSKETCVKTMADLEEKANGFTSCQASLSEKSIELDRLKNIEDEKKKSDQNHILWVIGAAVAGFIAKGVIKQIQKEIPGSKKMGTGRSSMMGE